MVCMSAKYLQSDVCIKFERSFMSIMFRKMKSISKLGSYLKKHPFFPFFYENVLIYLGFRPKIVKKCDFGPTVVIFGHVSKQVSNF